MKEVIIVKEQKYSISLSEVPERTPIFVKYGNKLIGMVVKELYKENRGSWIIKLGADAGATGHHKKRSECIESGYAHNYSFFIEED